MHVNMAAVDDRKLSSDLYEQPEPAASAAESAVQAIDISCIHWGYLNSALVADPTKKIKELTWKTYWVDLCGSTLRLYRDLSLSPDSATYPPPSRVIGPTNQNEKKEAFLVLKKGASISIWDNDKIKSKKKSKKTELPKYNVFKLQVFNSHNSPVYLFEAPSKSSMYRWISKIEEGIDMADNPQNHSTSDNKLQEAKLLAMESRRYQALAPELKYSDIKDDTDSGMEGDEDTFEVPEKPPTDPRLENLCKALRVKQDLLNILEEGEKAFIGNRQSSELIKVSEFKATTKTDYYLIPGYAASLIPQATQINVLGQLPNKRWRCYVDLPKTSTQPTPSASTESDISSLTDSRCSTPSYENTGPSLCFDNSMEETERLIGSVPSSLLFELDQSVAHEENLAVIPMGTPDVTPNPSPLPSPPPSPYSTHKYKETSRNDKEDTENFPRRSPTNLQRFVPSMDLSDVDAWEQFILPSPPSTPVTSRSTTPSLSPCESLENLDAMPGVEGENDVSLSDDIPVTVIGSMTDDECSIGNKVQHNVVMRIKDEAANESQKNYSFLVTKKLRQRGISLIVGSSSSEDEDDEEYKDRTKSKLTRRKLDEEFERFSANNSIQATVRPYSAFVPRKSNTINFGISSKPANLRTTTTDELLRDYSSSNVTGSKTCVTIKSLGGSRTPENAPPLNQRRTIQMERSENGGFGFTLQTYGIVQQNGDVEYMTFVLSVEEDGPAYMAGMRPGDIIIAIENQDTEEADHKTIVELLQKVPATVRMVVVFVNAIKRMHLNTKIKVLKTELQEREKEFRKLSEEEQQLLSHMNTITDIDILSPTHTPHNSYLYTTELTSSFSKDTPKVKDSLVQYKQLLDQKPRRTSLPDQRELKKQQLVSTTSNELLKTFASSAESMLKKSASVKLKRKVMKTKQSSQTFKSYVDIDDVRGGEFSGEGPLRTSSPLASTKTKDNDRLSWPTTSQRSPSTEQDIKSKSLSLNSKGEIGSSPMNGKSPGEKPITITRSVTNPPADGPSPGETAKTRSVTNNVDGSPEITAPSNTVEKEAANKGKNSVTSVCAASANLSNKFETSGVSAKSSGCIDGRTGPNKEKTVSKDNAQSVDSSDESVKQTTHERWISKTVTTNKDCPNKNIKTEEIIKSSLPCHTHVSSSASPKLPPKSPKVPRANTPYSLMSGSSSKDRPCSNNIASLCKIFEGKSSPISHSSDIVEEERDVFPIDIHQEPVNKQPEIARTRLGSRPMSYMCAMDAAEESPLIPDENDQTEKGIVYESSA